MTKSEFKNQENFFFRASIFFQCSPHLYLQLCPRRQIDQKIPSKDTDFLIFTYHFCTDSCQISMENDMDKLIMQNGFFGHTEGTKKVSAGLKNTKIKIAKKRPIAGRIAHIENSSKKTAR